ncbi:RNA polymerase sigma factor [Natranaerobius trueperi]|uniref:RNA polymerase sigma-70 region 4 domain-containing protein n=1 Tax=Natranaerobius trueperi TaxID=759412 RepID=A0A226BUN5_9FIRM|nr:sigma-70 family RNA polymerase sigma factor [Natranaerobius trueperi]OWZ82685.1 hypothetical protein CDO51_12720 [Natranaerobius trueperi]
MGSTENRLKKLIELTIKYTSLNYKKNLSKFKSNNQLTLNNDEVLNLIPDSDDHIDHKVKERSLKSVISDPGLFKAIEKLTPRQQQTLQMLFVENKTEKEVAEQLNVSVQAINKNKRTAINQLREELEKGGF